MHQAPINPGRFPLIWYYEEMKEEYGDFQES